MRALDKVRVAASVTELREATAEAIEALSIEKTIVEQMEILSERVKVLEEKALCVA